MNQSKLKTYARQARRDFIAAVSDRASFYGLTPDGIEPVVEQGDAVLIGDRPFPRDVAAKRKRLLEKRFTRDDDFDQAIEAMAYTWFNRFVAIRYMELHGYLDHGYRVLSHPEGGEQPELLEHAAGIDLPGLDRDKVVDLKLDGAKDEELYRLLLQAQCNALHRAMPFLFDLVGDETELLLPANLLHTDSLIRQLVNGIDESDWDEIEIVGWLYQFYISEKKDEVIGKVVKPEDIPAATQMFTPNWIVKYMVQNSLGAQWLATYPNSSLKERMEYYIEPAEQVEEVNAQLAALTPDSINPEELTLIDPACGSGHILVEAYDLFKAIYLERGYPQTDVPKLILEKNLFGLDIDERAAQLTGFALMMKGRADDRRLFKTKVKLKVMAFVNSTGFDVERLVEGVKLVDYGLRVGDLMELKRLFEHARTFGSLIQVPEDVAAKLPALRQSRFENQDLASRQFGQGELLLSGALELLGSLIQQAEFLATQYDAVVSNPPYMGGKGMHALVKKFTKGHFPDAKADLFACSIERGYTLSKCDGSIAMVTMQSWMFLSTFKKMREKLLREKTISTMVHMSNGVMSIAFGTVATVLRNRSVQGYVGDYSYTSVDHLNSQRVPMKFPVRNDLLRQVCQGEFKKIPGSPVAYWVSSHMRRIFTRFGSVEQYGKVCSGHQTGNNEQFLRQWFEVSILAIGFRLTSREDALMCERKWFPHKKGGPFRRWYGNCDYVLNWEEDGTAIRQHPSSALRNLDHMFVPGVTWSHTSSGSFSARISEEGSTFNVEGPTYFSDNDLFALGFFCSPVASYLMQIVNPTMHFLVGSVSLLPYQPGILGIEASSFDAVLQRIIDAYRTDWNAYERSWDFQLLPTLAVSSDLVPTIESSCSTWVANNRKTIIEMKRLEEENNRLFIDAYGLQDELTPNVPIEKITLTVNPAYRYGGKLTEEEQWTRFRQDTIQEIVSYAIGCMMGRYSLDKPGLIYAHGGNANFDSSRYTTFPADQDGIIPVTDGQWFDDDVAHRFIEFISKAWDAGHLEDNLSFLANNLSPRKNDTSRETIRRYLCDSFFKNHLQTYRNRPIYWLFSSGRAKAFQCLVYLHRYNEGTLARMRTEYAVPLQGMMESRIRRLDEDITAAVSTAHRKRLEKERSTLVKQQAELQTFDEKLRHYADRRIGLDLDDGVKVNYGKFGDLLVEVKKVTGRKAS